MTTPTIGDALGEALLAELAFPGAGDHVLERDDGFCREDAGALYFTEPEDWYPGEADGLAGAFGRVLDIGAGAGRHAVALQQRGLDVTALEPSPGAAEVCRRRGLRVVEATLDGHGGSGERYDTLVMLGHNLGLLESDTRAGTVLDALGVLAAPDAVLIGSGRDPHQLVEPEHVAYVARNEARGRLPGQWRLRMRWRRLATPWFDWLYLSIPEVRDRFGAAGWGIESVFVDGVDYVVVMRRRSQPR